MTTDAAPQDFDAFVVDAVTVTLRQNQPDVRHGSGPAASPGML